MLAAAALMALVLVGLALGTGARVARIAARGRRAGYPWSVIVEVLGDRWRDTEALMNARGPYALSEAETCSRFLRLRRTHLVLLSAAATLALLGALGGIALTIAAGSAASSSVPPVVLLSLVFAPALLLLAAMGAAFPEVRWRNRNASALAVETHGAVVREELVRGWLRSAGRGEHAPSRAAVRPVIVAGVVAVGAAAVIAVVVALVAVW